ncbi:hypothetical protein TCE0_017r03279 [Talaromyces pinophilus]|uniref:Uncharacterized protein n=1 Tax=Talaromyces pinophilus TaxID=128442 RepID=A0A6V8H211_TALPI|nr:hypothetical protein TCE0_017r03279 [Talaromyces pinophilus]
MPVIMPTGYSQMLQAWTQEPSPQKRESDTTSHGNGQQAVNILLGVILGFAVFFVLTIMLIFYYNRRSRRIAKDPNGKISLNRLQKLEAVAPTRNLEEWWPTVQQSLGLSQGVDNHFVW